MADLTIPPYVAQEHLGWHMVGHVLGVCGVVGSSWEVGGVFPLSLGVGSLS